MRTISLVILLALPAQSQGRLSDDQIDQVIGYAQTGSGFGGVRCHAAARQDDGGTPGGGFAVMLSGPAGRIFDAVKAAQSTGVTFSRAQVTPEMAATTLTVLAYPDAPTSADVAPAVPTRLLIRAPGSAAAITPRTSRVVPLSWSNGQGSTIAGHGLRATFAFADFARTPGALEVIVFTAGGPRTCTIDATVRASIH